MARYLGRRLLQTIPVLLGATLLIYAMVFALPGDPIRAIFGEKAVSPAVIDQVRAEYNFDKPFIVQWLLFLRGALTLDFGNNFSGQPVNGLIAQAFPVTLRLGLMAFVIEGVVGIAIGTVSGLRRGGWFDSLSLVLSLLLIAVPTFVLGFVLQFLLGVKLQWLPATAGAQPGFTDLLMPALVLAGVSLAYVIRLTRTQVSRNLAADYVRTARAKGLGERRVISVHVLRNSLIPVVTFLGGDLGALMGGAIVTERIFNIHGIGWLLYDGINRGEATTVVSVVTLLVLIFIVSNLLVDLLYAVLDPRIRYA